MHVRIPTDNDVWKLGTFMRRADREELEAVCDLSPREAVLASVKASDPAFLRAHLDDFDRVICIRGCSPTGEGRAAPWLLATDLLEAYWLALHRQALRELPVMLAKYPVLSNVIDARQLRVISWLDRLGFEFGEAEAYRAELPLLRFERVCR